jgi:hypothetical protein
MPWLLRRVRHTGTADNGLSLWLLYLWFLLPVILTLVIFSPAFLKFLLAASPPLVILLALLIDLLAATAGYRKLMSTRLNLTGYLVGGTLLMGLSMPSLVALYHYYANPTFARDNYRGIVNFIKAVGDKTDAVILNAEGQQDVFNYYYARSPRLSAPVHPLPRQRPLDEAVTINELQTIAAGANRVYAVYWATHQADPNSLIETWLNTHLYKATDQWYGNVRLVSYASPQTDITDKMTKIDHRLGEHIRLTGYALPATLVTPGEILQLALQWETDTPLTENYVVFAQLLDSASHLVGQRDAQPLIPTSEWPVDKPVMDAHGIFIEPGTPPGTHQLILGLYDGATGQRLPLVGDKDFIALTDVEIVHRDTPLPLEAFHIQTPLNTSTSEVTLLGYDFYKLGHRSAPETPLHSGDAVQLVAYWTSHQPEQRLADQVTIQVITNRGEDTPLSFTYPIAGVDDALTAWAEREIIRAQYDFFLSNLEPGTYRLRLTLQSDDAAKPGILTQPFNLEP